MTVICYINYANKMIHSKALLGLLISFVLLVISLDGIASDIVYERKYEVTLDSLPKNKEIWKVKAFQARSDISSDVEVPAKICFVKGTFNKCSEAIATVDDFTYNFQTVKELSKIELFKAKAPVNVILFVSEFSGGGSGSLRLISIWAYREEIDKFKIITPPITITEQGEYNLFIDKEGLEGLLVTADYILGENETHFARHKYKIKIYKINEATNVYQIYKEFNTNKEYKSLDEVDDINVIKPELIKIKELSIRH